MKIKMDRDRSDWSSWATRILNEDSDELMKYCQILKDKGKIPKIDKYSITRFSLMSLLKTLKKEVKSKIKSPIITG
jgi:hypothetical protein